MDKHDRFIAINQTLPGLEEFLKVVLGSEPLSEEANRQRIEFLRRLESVSRPPSLPPRPAHLSELYRAHVQQQTEAIPSGSLVPDESNLYKNDGALDPVEFASQQRELSRVANLYKTYGLPPTYAPQTVVLGEKGSKNGGLYFPRQGNTPFSRGTIRDSIQSTSSTEDDIYEHLSLKGISPCESITPHDGETDARTEETFVFPSPPKTPLEHSGTGIYVGGRPGSFRASAGKGKLSTGWFKKEAKLYEEVYASHLREPIIKGYLRDTKANKRRWCVLQGNRLHIFKSQEDPAIMIIDLLGCDIGVDDKKKISYSFRLTPKEGPGVSLAIEDGQDLSPWMSAIMAAVVRRGSIDRPNSPLDGAYTLEQARAERIRSAEVDGETEKEDEVLENFYELPVETVAGGTPVAHSTPVPVESDDDEDEGYDAPLPPLPIIDDYSSSESSSDEDESIEKKSPSEKAAAKKKIYDAIPADLLAELTAVKRSVVSVTNKSQDSICEEGSTTNQSLNFTDSHSEHSGNVSNRHSYIEHLASDDTGSSASKEEKSESLSRKRTSTVLSVSMDSVCSDSEETRSRSLTSETSITSKGLGPKVKRRRKLVPAEAELQFLQDPTAMHSGILYQKRRLVWSKRYCKIIDSRFKCYRNPADQKPSLDFPILGYDISLIDNKDSKKSYCIKISHPSQDTHYFATDSRISIERWIEVLSLAATGRLDVIAPYPPYFCAEPSGDELKSRSRESLLSSEGRLSDDDSADTLDDLDAPNEGGDSLKTNEEQSSIPANEKNAVLPDNASNAVLSTSVQTQTNSQEGVVLQSLGGGVKERVHKKRKEKPSDKEGTKTPSTMSPPHSMFISESVDGQAKPEPMDEECTSHPQPTAKESTEDSPSKKDRRWTDTLKKKKLTRGHSYDYRLRANMASASLPENTKNKPLSMRRKNSQTFAHLITLFDKEGRFCGYLTEVKYNKFGTTHLRRWCVVKNGVLNIYNSESEETPQGKLSLVDMWLTDKSDESRNKFAFSLEDKEGNTTMLQTTVKEDYQKWMGVLELFTELRVERPTREVTDPPRKPDPGATDDGEGSFERGTLRSKSMRAANKLKDEIYALAPGKVRSSLRMKLSQRVNVRDIFRKTHSSYDLEAAPSEGQTSALPEADVDTLAVFGGFLTQVEPNEPAPNKGNSRWCTIKEKELLVFADRKATDPLRRIALMGSVFSDLSDSESNMNRFQIRHGNENTTFDAWDKFDLSRWLRMLASATEHRNSSDDERPKCVGRLTSPTFTKKKILHRRTRSEALQEEEDKAASTTQWYTKTKEGSTSSTSSTDRLMSGYLQEVREAHGGRTLLRRWCVATSDKFIVYDNQNSKKASFEWELSQMEVQDQSDMDAGSFGFCVLLGDEKLCFKVIDEDSARHWLSVLARYCQPVPANQPLFKPPNKWRPSSKEDRRRSASDNDLKAAKSAEKETNTLEVLSEGRASGRKLLRRATEDSTFFRKFNRSELFKTPWRASSEKLEVKMRERSGRAAANKAFKRFSCGSLFDSEGKYSGHLMELITSELYSSQVRRWCLQKNDYLYVYENEAAEKPIKVIPLFDAKVVDTSDLEACVYRFRIDYGDNQAVFFRALTRSDLEKWTTVISVKTAVLQDRSERQLRRSRTLSLELQKSTDDITGSSGSDVTSPDFHSTQHLTGSDVTSQHLTTDSTSLQFPAVSPLSVCSRDSVFLRGNSMEEETSVTGSAGLEPVNPVDESGSTVDKTDEQSAAIDQSDDNTRERTFSDSNVKRVNRLSSIEDLSHIYENFLAFASAMAEKSPKFQEELYHVYENVTLAFDSRAQDTAQKEGEVTEERPGASTEEEPNKLRSPSSMEMSSEFEKISLREKDDQESAHVYRYSGICGESELENLEGVTIGNEGSVISTLVEDENEDNPEGNMLSGSLAGETDHLAVTDPSTPQEKSVDASSGDKENLPNDTVVEELLVGANKSESATSNEKYDKIEEVEDVQNDMYCLNVDSVNASNELNESQSESDEDKNEALTDVAESRSQTPLQDGGAQKIQDGVSGTTQVGPTLAHAVHVSTVETGASSFYLVQEVNEHVWREVEGNVQGEPVIETNVQVSTTAESATDRDSSASFVFEPAADNDDDDDEGIGADVEVEEPTVEGFRVGTQDDSSISNDVDSFNKRDVSNVDRPCFAVQEGSVGTTDAAFQIGNDCEGQFSVSETRDLKLEAMSSEGQDLREAAETLTLQDATQTEESSLHSRSYLDDIEGNTDKKEIQVRESDFVKEDQSSSTNCRNCEVIQNVCLADSFETSVPLASTCSTEVEVQCEQTVTSAVCECEHAQVWEEAVTRVDESASLTTHEFERETQALQESPSTGLESRDADDNPDVLPSEQGVTELTDDVKSSLHDISSQTDVRDSSQETETSGTVTSCPERIPTELNHGEGCRVEIQSTDITSCYHDTSLDNDSLKSNLSPRGGVDGAERSPLTKCSSDEEYFTPEDTIDLSEGNNCGAERDFTESRSKGSRAQNITGQLYNENDETCSVGPVCNDDDKTVTTSEGSGDSQKERVRATEPSESDSDSKNSQRDSLDTWSNSSNLEDKQELTKSQMDILKAVTAAFEEILELHGDDSDAEDTRL